MPNTATREDPLNTVRHWTELHTACFATNRNNEDIHVVLLLSLPASKTSYDTDQHRKYSSGQSNNQRNTGHDLDTRVLDDNCITQHSAPSPNYVKSIEPSGVAFPGADRGHERTDPSHWRPLCVNDAQGAFESRWAMQEAGSDARCRRSTLCLRWPHTHSNERLAD
jgi:hypothetical protein